MADHDGEKTLAPEAPKVAEIPKVLALNNEQANAKSDGLFETTKDIFNKLNGHRAAFMKACDDEETANELMSASIQLKISSRKAMTTEHNRKRAVRRQMKALREFNQNIQKHPIIFFTSRSR